MPRPSGNVADCATVVRALWDYLDRELEAPDMVAIDAHLAQCASCRAHFAFERQLIETIHSLRAQHAEPDVLRSRLLELLRRARTTDPDR